MACGAHLPDHLAVDSHGRRRDPLHQNAHGRRCCHDPADVGLLHTLWGYGTDVVMNTTTVTVTGMSCGHCATSVREEIGDIPGVHAVKWTLQAETSPSTVTARIEAMTIRTAVEDAGYQLAG